MKNLDLSTMLTDVTLDDKFSLSKDKLSKAAKETKSLLVTWDFSDVTIEDVLQKAKTQARIAWQNANRSRFDQFTDGENIGTINVSAAGHKLTVDVEKAAAGKYAGGSLIDKVKLISNVMGLPFTAVADMVAQKENVDVSEVLQAIDAYEALDVRDEAEEMEADES